LIFTCDKNIFCEEVNILSKGVAVKSSIPALEGIKLELNGGILSMTAYNLEIGIRTEMEVSSGDSGSCVINAKLLADISRRMPGDELKFSVSENKSVKINSGNAEYTLAVLPVGDFPDLPKIEGEESFEITQQLLKSMLIQTVFAVSTTDAKPVLSGVLFEISDGNFNMVAMDGYRLALRKEKIPAERNFYFIVPYKALNDIKSILKDEGDVVLSVDARHAKFEIDGYTFYTRLIDGQYHNYKANITDGQKTEIIVGTNEFMGMLSRCGLLVSDKAKAPVKCKIDGGEMLITCETVLGKVEDSVEVTQNGEEVLIGFSDRFMLDAIKASETEKVRIFFPEKGRPIKIMPLMGDSFIYIIMPVIIS
jgi:DNA polymerase-3 subunit beta